MEGAMAANYWAKFVSIIILILAEIVFTSQQQGIAWELELPGKDDNRVLQDSIVKSINDNLQAGWKASVNQRFANYTVSQFKHLLGAKPLPAGALSGTPLITHRKGLKLPKAFDARTAWPQCSTINDILDQGHCGSCWAFAAVEALSDRFCIHFGKCDPYFDQTGCSHPGCEPAYPTPKCEKKCTRQNLVWQESKHFAASAYRISSDPYSIMAEILTNGPVEVAFTVYEDFAHYKSGVYRHIVGDELGGHAVKLIGWGTTDSGEDYWLIANQWNRSWGENGYFKIIRGTNECGIEEDVVSGLPSSRILITQKSNTDMPLDPSE